MKTVVIECWRVTDWNEDGRAPTKETYFSDPNQADRYMAKSPWRSKDKFRKVYNIFDTFEESKNAEREDTKARALAKLTEAEKAALGLK